MIYYALLSFFVFEYLRPGNFIPGLNALHLNSVIPVAVVLGTLFGRSKTPNVERVFDANGWIFASLLLLITTSAAVADNTFYAYQVFTSVVGYVLIYWVITKQVSDISGFKGIFVTLVLIHLTIAALTPEMFTDPGERHYLATGTFLGDGNDFALSVNVVVPFCLFLMYDAKRMPLKLFWGTALLILVLCIVATQSRGGTLALAAVGIYYWMKSDRKVLTGALAVVAVSAVLIFAPSVYFERMNSISNYEEDGSAQGRITAWHAGTRMALSHPLTGVGAGNFPGSFPKYAPPGPDGPLTSWKTAHSIYFLILGELGFPGAALLVSFIVTNLIRNRRVLASLRAGGGPETQQARLLACLSASLLAYAVGGAFLSAVYYPHMYVLGGLLSAARVFTGNEAAESSATPAPVEAEPTLHWALRRSPKVTRAS